MYSQPPLNMFKPSICTLMTANYSLRGAILPISAHIRLGPQLRTMAEAGGVSTTHQRTATHTLTHAHTVGIFENPDIVEKPDLEEVCYYWRERTSRTSEWGSHSTSRHSPPFCLYYKEGVCSELKYGKPSETVGKDSR